MQLKAIILGSTGLTGFELTRQLLVDPAFEELRLPLRHEFPINDPKLTIRIIDFAKPESWQDFISGDILFSCIGTTNKKVKGDKDLYRHIDHDIPVNVAKAALKNGVKKLIVISALGANIHSHYFYSRLKAEVEASLQALPFESIHILRPSFLLGERKEFRFGEKAAEIISPVIKPFLKGNLRKYRPIEVSAVARAMINMTKADKKGKFIYESDEIKHQLEE